MYGCPYIKWERKVWKGMILWDTVYDGDTTKVPILLSTEGVESFINFQDGPDGITLHSCPEMGW